MSESNLLKQEYDLEDTALVREDNIIVWQGRYDELSISSVVQKIQQDLDLENSLDKAIEILLENPFVGDQKAGELLTSVAAKMQRTDLKRGSNYIKLVIITEVLNDNMEDFEWKSEIELQLAEQNLKKIEKLLL